MKRRRLFRKKRQTQNASIFQSKRRFYYPLNGLNSFTEWYSFHVSAWLLAWLVDFFAEYMPFTYLLPLAIMFVALAVTYFIVVLLFRVASIHDEFTNTFCVLMLAFLSSYQAVLLGNMIYIHTLGDIVETLLITLLATSLILQHLLSYYYDIESVKHKNIQPKPLESKPETKHILEKLEKELEKTMREIAEIEKQLK